MISIVHTIIMTAPDEQLDRAQIIYRDHVGGNIENAATTAIHAAMKTKASDPKWSALCAEYVAQSIEQLDDDKSTNCMPFMAALLDIAAENAGLAKTEVDKAVYMACISLQNGDKLHEALYVGLATLRGQILI